MRAIGFRKHGSLDEIEFLEVEQPTITPDDVLIKVKVFSLNRLDIWTREGLPTLKLKFPHIGSSEFSGEIMEVGSKVPIEINVGDKVVINAGIGCRSCDQCRDGEHTLCSKFHMIGEHIWGGASEYAVVPWQNILKVPTHVELINAAATSLTGMTVYRMLKRANFKVGMKVLVIGSGGGVGSMAVQLSHKLGGEVYALTSTKEKEQKSRELGAKYVVNYKETPEWSKEIWKLTNKSGVDLVLDSTGENVWEQGIRCLKKGGKFVICGATSGNKGNTHIGLVFWKQLEIIGSTMANDSEFKEFMSLVFNNKIKPVIDSVYDFKDAIKGYKRLEDQNHLGKIIIKM